jgi:hypothetical protein
VVSQPFRKEREMDGAPGKGDKLMKLRIIVQPADCQSHEQSYFQDFPDFPEATETLFPNVGDSVQINSMKSPKIVKARHFKYFAPNTLANPLLEVRLDVIEK